MPDWRWPCTANMRMNWEQMHASLEAIEKKAEAYLFRRMTADDVASYEEHLLLCEDCRQAVEITEQFIEIFRLAADPLDPLSVEFALR
jgi:hypothetical protein